MKELALTSPLQPHALTISQGKKRPQQIRFNLEPDPLLEKRQKREGKEWQRDTAGVYFGPTLMIMKKKKKSVSCNLATLTKICQVFNMPQIFLGLHFFGFTLFAILSFQYSQGA